MKTLSPTALMGIPALALILSACGGGGGGGSGAAPVAPPPPGGLYAGLLGASNYPLHALLLENGQYWGLYSNTAVTGSIAPSAFVQGAGSVVNGVFTSSDVKDFGPLSATPGTISASYVPQASLSGSIGVGALLESGAGQSSVPITGHAIDSRTYVYNSPARIGDIALSWSMTEGNSSDIVTLDIDASGKLAGTRGACTFSGTLTPRASGKNVFDALVNFGAACARLAGQSASGIALSYTPDAIAPRRLFLAVTNAARTEGTVLSGAQLTATTTVAGSGPAAVNGNTVQVHYAGWLYNGAAANLRGAQIDSSAGKPPLAFKLGAGDVIAGWDLGVAGMKVGSKRTLIVPAHLGYGTRGMLPEIPPNANLVFEIELLSVN